MIIIILELSGLYCVKRSYFTTYVQNIMDFPLKKNTNPVSYTHLDVYKRQLYRSVKHQNEDCIDNDKHFNLNVAQYLLWMLWTWHPSKGRIKPNYQKINNKATGKDMGILENLRFVNVGTHLPAGIEKGYRRCILLYQSKRKEN